jgi:hypothetical protein
MRAVAGSEFSALTAGFGAVLLSPHPATLATASVAIMTVAKRRMYLLRA